MKKAFSVFSIVIVIFLFFSCASDPALITDIPDLTSTPPLVSAPEHITQEDLLASDIDGNPEVEAEPENILEPELETPGIINTPILPDTERLLYFYPEPEALLALPIIPNMSENLIEEKAKEESKPQKELPLVVPPVISKPSTQVKPTPPPVSVKPPVKETLPVPEEKKEVESLNDIPGIWETEPVAPSISNLRSASGIIPSRSTDLYSNQTLEVWYPGSGWVYLGDASSRNGLSYQTRKLDGKDTLFTFKAQTPGSYILEFSRFDVLSDTFSSDALAVTVKEPDSSRIGKIRAPNFTFNSSESESANNGIKQVNSLSNLSNSLPIDEPVLRSIPEQPRVIAEKKSEDPSALIRDVKAALSNGGIDTALNLLDQFFAVALSDLDEGWFLRGQAYEANSEKRDIRKALNAYETLVSAYPDSQRWGEADSRIRYIRQFYLRIR